MFFMREYLSAGIFKEYEGIVHIKRGVSSGGIREGLLLCVDLKDYSFVNGAKTLIRASEGTVLERLPPRVAVREECPLELPHIMLLYDDPEFKVMSAVKESCERELYDFELNMSGGHIEGSLIENADKITAAFIDLMQASRQKYKEDILFAVGDGNHSLAAAKVVYKNAVKAGRGEECRYALCEAVNLYDPTLIFEPIHRLIFTSPKSAAIEELKRNMPPSPIEAVAFTDGFAAKNGLRVDYIHGADSLNKLALEFGAAAVALKPMDKADFFPFVIKNGSLPKKTFSMGEAEDKRYYLEAAKIV